MRAFKKLICFLAHHDLREPCEKQYINNMFFHIYKFKCNRCSEWLAQSTPKVYSSPADYAIENYPKLIMRKQQ
jgi:hypothetical protein